MFIVFNNTVFFILNKLELELEIELELWLAERANKACRTNAVQDEGSCPVTNSTSWLSTTLLLLLLHGPTEISIDVASLETRDKFTGHDTNVPRAFYEGEAGGS